MKYTQDVNGTKYVYMHTYKRTNLQQTYNSVYNLYKYMYVIEAAA